MIRLTELKLPLEHAENALPALDKILLLKANPPAPKLPANKPAFKKKA